MWTDQARSARAYSILTVLIAALVLASSGFGILVKGTYSRETSDWASQAQAQDAVNVVAVVVLLVAAYFTVEKWSVRGLLVWAGSLLFLIYGFVIFAFASHYNDLFLLYVATLGASVYAFLGGVLRLDFEEVKRRSAIGGRGRLALSALLLVVAGAFYALWLSEDVPSLLNGTVPASVTTAGLLVNPIHVLDMGLYLPAMVITAVSLRRDGALGHTFTLPLLTFSVLTVLGIAAIVV